MLDWWQALLFSLPALAVAVVAAFYGPAFADRIVQRRRADRDFRQAQRLVADELIRLSADLKYSIEGGVAYVPESVGMFSTQEWEAHKTTLADLLDQPTWDAVAKVYLAVVRIRYAFAATSGTPIGNEYALVMANTADSALKARGALEAAAAH